jgi:hypothetical protein
MKPEVKYIRKEIEDTVDQLLEKYIDLLSDKDDKNYAEKRFEKIFGLENQKIPA